MPPNENHKSSEHTTNSIYLAQESSGLLRGACLGWGAEAVCSAPVPLPPGTSRVLRHIIEMAQVQQVKQNTGDFLKPRFGTESKSHNRVPNQ